MGSIKSGLKSLCRNPLFFGIVAGIFVIFFNIAIVSIIEGSLKNGYSVFLDNGIFIYLVPPAVGVQMGLFRWHRNITSGKKLCASEKIGMTGSVTSSLTMVLCCLHHAGELLPAAGFILAASRSSPTIKTHSSSQGCLQTLWEALLLQRKSWKKERENE